MMPVLYGNSWTEFTSNGVGVLSDTVSCTCTEVLNGSYELELKVPKDGKYAPTIGVNCVIKVKPNYMDDPQPFRVYSVEQDIDGYITVKAAHLAYDTAGIPILPFTASTLEEAVGYMNNNRKLVHDSEFLLTTDFSKEATLTVDTPSSFRSLLAGNDNTIATVYGGEYHYDNYIIELLEQRGYERGVCFRYGKNILDFNQEMNSEDLYSGVLGFWKKSSSNQDEPPTYIYGDIVEVENVLPYDKILVLDVSDKVKNEDGSDPSSDQVTEYVHKYIEETAIGIPNYSMKIAYSEDDNIIKVCLGDTVGVIFPEYGINSIARCSKVTFDCLLERNESIEIGVANVGVESTIASASNTASGNVSSSASSFNGQGSDIRYLSNSKATIYYDTTASWNSKTDLVSEAAAIYIYSDHRTITVSGSSRNVPGMKIGDGHTLLTNIPFIDDGPDAALTRSGETLMLST